MSWTETLSYLYNLPLVFWLIIAALGFVLWRKLRMLGDLSSGKKAAILIFGMGVWALLDKGIHIGEKLNLPMVPILIVVLAFALHGFWFIYRKDRKKEVKTL